MEDQGSGNDLSALLDDLAVGLADPDCDVDALHDVEEQLVAAQQAALIPRLEAHLEAAVQAGNWYGRCVLARILATTAGRSCLATLLRAFSRDLGDDQDDLTTTLVVFAQEDPVAARSILVPWVETSDKDLRRAAIWLFGYVPPEPADLPLLTQAARDPDERLRSTVVGTLGSHGKNPAAVDLLVSLLADPSTQVRVSALSSLGFLHQPGTLPHVFRLADDSTTRIRAWVAIALGRFHAAEHGDPNIAAVLDRLRADPDPYVREQATTARRMSSRST
ncbi:HEAT repeat domain-containing protein [Streptomyces sp. NPDC048277]|uniref:HEAT repeat domain-containing protein n=1 Tax=Streptomyces sp. NPDC048277 TaxID=3155027 RepID=UPI0033FB364A